MESERPVRRIKRREFLKISAVFTTGLLLGITGYEENGALEESGPVLSTKEIESRPEVPVLITGFEPWNGRKNNTAADVAQLFSQEENFHNYVLNNLVVDTANHFAAASYLIEQLETGELSEVFKHGGVLIMLGEGYTSGAVARIEQVVQIGDSEKLGLPTELYDHLEQAFVDFAELEGMDVSDIVSLPEQNDLVGDFVCGATFLAMLAYSKKHPERKILPLFIHVPHRVDREPSELTFRVLEVVQSVLRSYFYEHQSDLPHPSFYEVFAAEETTKNSSDDTEEPW